MRDFLFETELGEAHSVVCVSTAETWSLSLNPNSLHLATAGAEARVKILSSAVENFGEELTTMDATGTFGSAVEYVRPCEGVGWKSLRADSIGWNCRARTEGFLR